MYGKVLVGTNFKSRDKKYAEKFFSQMKETNLGSEGVGWILITLSWEIV